jgi:hypothetical protein
MPATGSVPFSDRTKTWPKLPVLIAALIGARLLFMLLMPATYSTDLHSWLRVMNVLDAGGNPYKETDVLNWPPFWMQILFGLHHLAKHTGISDVRLIQFTLITGEALTVCAAYLAGRKFFPARNLFAALLWGICLNPVAIFLSCQHCNYDVFVGLFVLLGILALCAWQTTQNREAWLAACFFIGMGILAKTVPVILTPLLLLGFRRLPLTTKAFGALLVAAPFIIGMSVLISLAPYGVRDHVINYRSLAGWYGITGLLLKAGLPGAMETYQRFSPLLFLVLMTFTAFWCYRQDPVQAKNITALALVLMMFIPTFGPGYSPPYVLWYLPLAILLYTTAALRIKIVLLSGWIILMLTYATEYALFESHGAFARQWYPASQRLINFSEQAESRGGQTLIRLPVFLFYLVLFAVLFKELRSRKSAGLKEHA